MSGVGTRASVPWLWGQQAPRGGQPWSFPVVVGDTRSLFSSNSGEEATSHGEFCTWGFPVSQPEAVCAGWHFARAAGTKQQSGQLNQEKPILWPFWRRKHETGGLAGSASSEVRAKALRQPLSPWLAEGVFSRCPHTPLSESAPPLLKGHQSYWIRSHKMTSFYSNNPLKCPSPDSLKLWGLRLQRAHFRRTHFRP